MSFNIELKRSEGKWCLEVRGPEWLVEELTSELEKGSVFHYQTSCTHYSITSGRWISERVSAVLDKPRGKEESSE